MQIKRFVVGPLSTNCYLVSSGDDAVVIDPGDEGKKIFDACGSMNVHAVVLTHGHCDHIGACHFFRDKGIPILIGAKDEGMLTDSIRNLSTFTGGKFVLDRGADRLLEEGDTVAFGSGLFSVVNIPGHSPGGIALIGEGVVFSGDVLFADSIGRSDLPGGDYRQLEQSIKEKLYCLADGTVVYPGHGPETTIGKEKRHNPFVRL